MNKYPPGRRDFLKKMTALGAAGELIRVSVTFALARVRNMTLTLITDYLRSMFLVGVYA